jgi:WD40 repeat protein
MGTSTKEIAIEIAQLREQEYFNVWGLDFSADGKYLAASSPSSPEIHVWDWRNRFVVRTLQKIRQGSSSIVSTEPIRYSPDGRLLATCHGRADHYVVARIWNADTGEIVRDIKEPDGGECKAIGFTPDGKSFVWVSDRSANLPGDHLIVYSTATWQPVWGLRTVPFYPSTLSISPDGTLIAIGGSTIGPPRENQILIVDVAQRAVQRTIHAFPTSKLGDGDIERLVWHPDGVHLAASARVTGRYRPDARPDAVFESSETRPDAVRIFDVRSGELVASEKPVEYARIWALRYTPDGKYLVESGFYPGTEVSSGARRELLRIDSGPRTVESVIRIWDGEHHQLLQEIRGAAGSAAVTRDGHYLALGGDGMIFVFELK